MRFLSMLSLLFLCESCHGQTGGDHTTSKEDCLLQDRYLHVSSKKYDEVKNNCRLSKAQLRQRYLSASSDSLKQAILQKAKHKMVSHLLDSIIPFWYKTVWSFEGHSEVPRQGEIACGYFVSTTLLHAGLKLNRTNWPNKIRSPKPIPFVATPDSFNGEILILSKQ